MDRKKGYYWVKLYDNWVIGEYNGECWNFPGYDHGFFDTDTDEIDETPIER